jgi:hypothetical protein
MIDVPNTVSYSFIWIIQWRNINLRGIRCKELGGLEMGPPRPIKQSSSCRFRKGATSMWTCGGSPSGWKATSGISPSSWCISHISNRSRERIPLIFFRQTRKSFCDLFFGLIHRPYISQTQRFEGWLDGLPIEASSIDLTHQSRFHLMTREKPSLETLWLKNIGTMDKVQKNDRSNTAPS